MSIAHQNAHTIIRDILSKQHIERVWFVGCGGSLTGFWPGKYFLDCEAKKLAVGYVTSNEFVHATPNALGKNSVVILASQQGNTAETVEAARIARQKGAASRRGRRASFAPAAGCPRGLTPRWPARHSARAE
ncbi:phosphosugar isomerase [Klebsiella pneumoniae]|nr:phosphosugar isomerase [Klebsiella pneumoniae]